MRYDHLSMLPERAFQPRGRFGMTLEGGGGGPSAPTQQTVTQTNVPEYARPYVETMLGATQQQLFNTRPVTTTNPETGQTTTTHEITGVKPYIPYSTDPTAYVAGFSPMQQQAFQGAAQLQVPGEFGGAAGATAAAIERAMGMQYQPGYFGNQFRAPAAYAPGRFSMLEAEAPELQQYQMGPAREVSAQAVGTPLMETAQTGYRPELQQYQMGPAERVTTGTFAEPGVASTYMSPYMQNVVDIQQREAQRASNIAAQTQRAQAVGAGAFGGSRQALVEAERQRNLATQLGDIQATGQQAAFQQAQQQFNQEQQARMQAALANQQAGLTVGQQNLAAKLGVQQLGAGQIGLQTSLANLSAAQQANVQNQAAQLQAQGLNAQQALQAALANQQAGLTVGQQNLAAQLGIQQLGAGQSLQAQLANQQALQAAQQAAEQSRQFGYGQAMTAAQQRAQFGLAGQQAAEQSRQYGAGLGMQGLGLGLQGAGQLANIGQQRLGAQQGILGLQQQYGGMQQAQQQNIINQAIQNYAMAQQYPQQQLAFMNAMLRGLPLQSATVQSYQAPPSPFSQIAGLGTSAYALGKMGGAFAEGGEVQGIDDLLIDKKVAA